jgi:antitoxin HigA-1
MSGGSVFVASMGALMILKSSTTIERGKMASCLLIHPGTILREEFLEPMGITPYRLAKDINVPLTRITAILAGHRSISADTALRLSRYFDMSERFWMNLQTNYDLQVTKDKLSGRLKSEVKPHAA